VTRIKWIGLGLTAAACVAGGALWRQHSRVAPQEAPAAMPAPTAAASAELKMPAANPAPAPVDLEHSDGLIREKAKALSAPAPFSAWLQTEDLIRRITAATNAIADGTSPRESLGFLSPKRKFRVKQVQGQCYLDPGSYSRYDPLANVIQSLNAQAVASLIKELAPYFQAASRELGSPPRDFQATLVKAIQELLKTPVVERPIQLREKVISYALEPSGDLQLESLSAAQKHLLRMGPKNTNRIQGKLRAIALALGVPEDQLPQSRIYTAR